MSVAAATAPGDQGVLESYRDAVLRADVRAALAVIEQAATDGRSVDALLRDVIGATQVEVGRRWQAGECSVADEHAATAIAEQARALVRRPLRLHSTARRRVVLACPEGEWHTLPARLAGDVAERLGIDVISVGGSCPAEHLGVFLRQARPDALALSVTLTTNLPSAFKAIQAAHLVGIPVVAGGAAWGRGNHRSQRLGVDIRVEDPGDLARAVNLVASGRPLRTPPPLPVEVDHLVSWDARRRPAEIESLLARATAAALACEDTTILDDMRHWLVRSPAASGLTEDVLECVTDRLADRLAEEAPQAAALLTA